MAKFFKPNKQLKSRKHASAAKQLSHFTGKVKGLDLSLKGIVSNPHERIAFVPGVMLGETIKVKPESYTDNVIQGQLIDIIEPSKDRIIPSCQHFENCGGCQLQYARNEWQVTQKETALKELMSRKLGISFEDVNQSWQPAIDANPWRYRRAARLSTWFHDNKIQLGFREKKSKHIIDINECPVLTQLLEKIAIALKPVLNELSIGRNATHVQLFDLEGIAVVVIRATETLSPPDLTNLKLFAETHNCHLMVEYNDANFEVIRNHSQFPSSILDYAINELTLQFSPKDFIQVNATVNKAMVAQALEWLVPSKNETILDLFAGVGNFTLPIAKCAKHVIAVEGVQGMVDKIIANAQLNKLTNVEAYQADLSKFDEKRPPEWLKPIDKLLLDPARDGALAVMQTIPKLKPKQILYISCNPITMVRDLKVLIAAGYKLKKAGILNMFPQTSHVEAMVLLEK